MGTIESFVAEHGMSSPIVESLVKLGPHLVTNDYADYRKAAQRVARLLETGGKESSRKFRWNTDEAWVEYLRAGIWTGQEPA